MKSEFKLDDSPSESEIKFTDDQIEKFNKAQVGYHDFEPLNLVLRNDEGGVVAGLLALTGWEWLYVKILWVQDDLRGQGLGSELLERAEQIARERGCLGACLSSFNFQAPEFYVRHGYAVFGQIEEYPQGSSLNFLSKRFAAES